METNKEQLLRNPEIEPTSDVIAKELGEANNAYIKFINELASHDIQIEWRCYNDGKAWLAKGLYKWIGGRGGQNETTVFFSNQIGKLKYFPLIFNLCSDEMYEAVFSLADFKKSNKHIK